MVVWCGGREKGIVQFLVCEGRVNGVGGVKEEVVSNVEMERVWPIMKV